MLLRRALPATRQSLAHPFPIYEMGSTKSGECQDHHQGQIPYPHWMAEGEAAGADLLITRFWVRRRFQQRRTSENRPGST
jgi:hypothetical protein